jgi:hypothetical protein
MLFFALALPAPAQQFIASMGSKTTGTTIPTSIPGFFTAPLAKPDFSAMSMKPSVPSPLNLTSMMPSFSNLQNTILLRNIFGSSPQTVMRLPARQVAPPPKMKRTLLP